MSRPDYFDFDRRAERALGVSYEEGTRRGRGARVTSYDIEVYMHERLEAGDGTWAANARLALDFLRLRSQMLTCGRCRELDEVVREIRWERYGRAAAKRAEGTLP